MFFLFQIFFFQDFKKIFRKEKLDKILGLLQGQPDNERIRFWGKMDFLHTKIKRRSLGQLE